MDFETIQTLVRLSIPELAVEVYAVSDPALPVSWGGSGIGSGERAVARLRVARFAQKMSGPRTFLSCRQPNTLTAYYGKSGDRTQYNFL